MKKRKAKTKKIKTSSFLILGVCALAAFFAIKLVQLQININAQEQILSEKQAQYQQLVDENAELEGIVSGGNEADYIERIARDELGYVKPGERVYYDISFGS